MAEDTETVAPKVRRPRSDKGKPRKPRAVSPPPLFTPAEEPAAPILVRVALKNGAKVEFGCARRTVENGFHVFFYPSEKDRYRETRREFAISEVTEIEITEARQSYDFTRRPVEVPEALVAPRPVAALPSSGPQIHSVRKQAGIIAALEQSSGPIKMTEMPAISFGDSQG